MLFTLLTLGTITATVEIATRIKKSRVRKREIKKAQEAVRAKFPDLDKRHVTELHVVLTQEETKKLWSEVGEKLDPFIISRDEALSILANKENYKE